MQRVRGKIVGGDDGELLHFAHFHTNKAYEEHVARIDRDILFADERQVQSMPK